jgi:type II secretory ATPase GspE/PulE/Tfp pilus assembly ATPase PilB-like protein/CheY-like chemotaxis protein
MKRLLLRLQFVSEGQIKSIEQRQGQSKLIAALAEQGDLDEDAVLEKVAKDLSLRLIDLRAADVLKKLKTSPLVNKLDAALALKHRCLLVEENKGQIVVAMADPLDTEALSTLEFSLECRIQAAMAKESDIIFALDRLAGARVLEEAVDDPAMSLAGAHENDTARTDVDDSVESMKDGSESAPVVRLVHRFLSDGLEQGASDIHLEPSEDSLEVRFRIDGVLTAYTTVPKRLQSYVLTRLKILSGMDITIKRRPQDGRFSISSAQATAGDVRVSSVPTPYGEKMVLRLLRADYGNLTFDSLGVTGTVLSGLLEVLASRDRMVVVTGPTGSGKSTTLYASIHHLRNSANNIITVEDPIEYRVEGVTQIQIDQKAGMSFASGLRSILRQDPDIIMVGEIRDLETAQIGFQAAQTGHLVLSTLHTNTAATAVVRLVDLGIEPFIISASLGAVLAQRLIRRVCPSCARELSAEEARLLQEEYGAAPDKARIGLGCRECEHTGYRGRVGVYSLLVVNQDIRDLIRERASEKEIEQAATKHGMQSLFKAACGLVEQGTTTIEEVERVIGKSDEVNLGGKEDTQRQATGITHKGIEQRRDSIDSVDDLLGSFISGVEEALVKPVADPAKQPRVLQPNIDELEASASVAALAEVQRSSGLFGAERKKVLLVDDDEGVRVVVSRSLRKANFEICEAENGYDALQKLNDFTPDVVVSDLVMPKLDGEEFIVRLRQDERTKAIPILVLSGSDSEANEIKLLNAGATDFVSKTASPAVLIARINRILG